MTISSFACLFNQHDERSRYRLFSAYVAGLLIVLFSVPVTAGVHKSDTRPAASLWYQELAAQGDVDAKYNLGMMNEVGWSIPVDVKKAVRWYREAAKQGHVEAQLRLGMLYYLGLGAKQSKLKGESWIRKAAKQDHSFAQLLNTKLFEEGLSDILDQHSVLGNVRKIYLQDEGKAIGRLHRLVGAAKRKSAAKQQAKEKSTIRERREIRVVTAANDRKTKKTDKAGVSKGKSQVKKEELKRIESVVPEFIGKKSLKENRTLAQSNLATIRLQAKKGLASAQYNLGRMYELGIKVPVDKSKALSWYKKSAAQGYAGAQYRLAISMLYGKSTERDERMGRKWLSSAASNGHQIAQNLLATLSDQAGGSDVGKSLAISWYLERAIAGNAEAALSLGKIFENGWGARPDLREAIKWYQHAGMLGAKSAEKFLQESKARLAQIKENAGGAVGEGEIEYSRPPDWIAYLMAITLAIGIIFWPLFMRRRKTGSGLQNTEVGRTEVGRTEVGRKEPPFD